MEDVKGKTEDGVFFQPFLHIPSYILQNNI